MTIDIPATITDEEPHLTALRTRAREALAPFGVEDFDRWEEAGEYPEPVFDAIRDAGFTALTIAPEFGGEGLGVLEACVVLEELSCTGGLAAGMILQMFVNGPSRAIREIGNAEQHARYLPEIAKGDTYFAVAMTEPTAGSSVVDMLTTLTPDGDGYRLSGEKCYITGATRANAFLVFCRIEGSVGPKGLGTVVVRSDQEGFRIERGTKKMGGNAIPEGELFFDRVRIKESDVVLKPDVDSTRGANIMLRQFNPERCGNAAMVLGVARAALEMSIRYSRERHQFGREICEFQGIQWKLADMAIRYESARLLLRRAATSDVDGFPDLRATMMAKIAANEAAEYICREAIQIHGHLGFTQDRPVERFYREVRGSWIGGGTLETNRNVLAAEVIGRRFSQRG